MILSGKNLRSHLPFLLFYVALIIVGISIYKDYGISWDEVACRNENGILNWHYVQTGDYHSLIINDSKYHGPAFEMFLVTVERTCGFKDVRDIYQMRHLVTFLLFAFALIFFYLLCLRYLKSNWLAFIGVVFLVLSPRIFADTFYNEKDLGFTLMFMIVMFTTMRFTERKNVLWAVVHGILTAILIDIRMLGLLIPGFTMLFLLIDAYRNSVRLKKIILVSCIYILTLLPFIVFFWPVLWREPLNNFILALKEMSLYPWDTNIFYLGKEIYCTKLPWHYIPLWILISTPILYLILFIKGLYFIFRKAIIKKQLSVFDCLNIYVFFMPILTIIVLHSVVYDGWRHVYFIYPSFIIICLIGIKNLNDIFTNKIINYSGRIFIFFYCLFMIREMINLHPYEHVYFNAFAGSSLADARNKFEIDYWGLSYKEGLEYILKNDTSSNFIVYAVDPPGFDNANILTEKDRARVTFTPCPELADYLITSYRFHHSDYKYPSWYDVKRNGGVLLSVFDLRDRKPKFSDDKYQVIHSENSYEKAEENWNTGRSTSAFTHSGKYAEIVDSSTENSSMFSFHPPKELTDSSTSQKYLSVKFYLYTDKPNISQLVLQIDSANGKCYEWMSALAPTGTLNKWDKEEFRFKLPSIHSTADNLKIYLRNTDHNNIYLDDWAINFYVATENDVKLIMAAMP